MPYLDSRLKHEIDTLDHSIMNLREELEKIGKKEKLLNSIPCGDSYPSCRFIKDAYIDVANKTWQLKQTSMLQQCA